MINQYEGVNAHLNDQLVTTPDAWKGFHDLLISSTTLQVTYWLDKQGLPYVADPIPGIQIHSLDDAGLPAPPTRPEPDIAIYEDRQRPVETYYTGSPTRASQSSTDSSLLELTLPQSFGMSAQRFRGIGIREIEERTNAPGRLAAWIEILSPTNKPAVPGWSNWGRHADVYAQKRLDLLHATQPITLVELDLLQAQPPVVKGLPRYQQGPAGAPPEPGASAFYAAVSDPRSQKGWPDGHTEVYEFGIEQPLPAVAIPLSGEHVFTLPFAPSYDQIVSQQYGRRIDYSSYPTLWNTYSPGDQDRIAARMETIELGKRQGQIHDRQDNLLPLAVPIQGARFRLNQRLDRGNGRSGMTPDR